MYMIMGSTVGEDDIICEACNPKMARAVIEQFEGARQVDMVSCWEIGKSEVCLYRSVYIVKDVRFNVKIRTLLTL